MPRFDGPWQGSTPRARISIDADHTYNADKTSIHVAGTAYIEFEANISDVSNNWWFTSDIGNNSGVNRSFQGAGRHALTSFAGWRSHRNTSIAVSVSGLEAVGAIVEWTMNYDVPAIAPTSDGTYYASSITATAASTAGIKADGKGTTLVDIQAQRNTVASATGATTHQSGSWKDVRMTGLRRATQYYFRVRVANTGFGWGPWGPWKSFITLATVPSAPSGYSNITSTSTTAQTNGIAVSDNGGSALTNVQGQVNTSQSATGAMTFTRGSWGNLSMTGLTRATNYYVRLRAANALGWGAWGPWVSFRTAAVIPTMATSYSAITLTRNSAVIGNLSVSDNGGESPNNARVQYNTSASASGAQVVTRGSWGNLTIPGLAAASTYYYRCAAANSAGWSAYPSTWKTFTTLSDAPDDMAPPTFSSVTDTSFTATWVEPNMNGASFSTYYYELSPASNPSLILASGTQTGLTRSFGDLTPGTSYIVRVRANATPNNGGFGEATQKTTGKAPNSGMDVYAVVAPTHVEVAQVVRTNRAANPRPLEGLTYWSYAGATNVYRTWPDEPGPFGLPGFARATVHTLDTTSSAGWFYRDPTIGGDEGDVVTVSMYVRPSEEMQYRMSITFRESGEPIVGGVNGPYVTCPADEWTRLSATATAPDTFDEVQAWAAEVTGSAPGIGETVDATCVLIEDGPALTDYFDGGTPSTPDTAFAWLEEPYLSPSITGPAIWTGPAVPGTLYTFINGQRKQLRPMWMNGDTMETE